MTDFDLHTVDLTVGPDELEIHLVTRAVDRAALDDDDFVMLLEMLLGREDELTP